MIDVTFHCRLPKMPGAGYSAIAKMHVLPNVGDLVTVFLPATKQEGLLKVEDTHHTFATVAGKQQHNILIKTKFIRYVK